MGRSLLKNGIEEFQKEHIYLKPFLGGTHMGVNSYQGLKVWQLGMDLAKEIYKFAKNLPKEELYGLTSQIRRAVVSIPANIAEGHARDSTKEFIRHISIAQGSLAELETHLLLAVSLEYCARIKIEPTLKRCSDESKMLSSLRRALKVKSSRLKPNSKR